MLCVDQNISLQKKRQNQATPSPESEDITYRVKISMNNVLQMYCRRMSFQSHKTEFLGLHFSSNNHLEKTSRVKGRLFVPTNTVQRAMESIVSTDLSNSWTGRSSTQNRKRTGQVREWIHDPQLLLGNPASMGFEREQSCLCDLRFQLLSSCSEWSLPGLTKKGRKV